MSEQLKWGGLYVYLYDDFVRVYCYVGGLTCVEYRLNKDGSLAELNTEERLIPSVYWHEVHKFVPRIKTYLMLKGCA